MSVVSGTVRLSDKHGVAVTVLAATGLGVSPRGSPFMRVRLAAVLRRRARGGTPVAPPERRHARRGVAVAVVGTMIAAGFQLVGVQPARAASLPAGCSESGDVVTCTHTFASGDGDRSLDLPVEVDSVTIAASGGAGEAASCGGAGGSGARIGADVPVAPGQRLHVVFESGGATDGCGGGGGTSADVRTRPRSSGLNPEPRLVVAAGGGGGGADYTAAGGAGGDAGGYVGADGATGQVLWLGFIDAEAVPNGGVGATASGPGGNASGPAGGAGNSDGLGSGGGAGGSGFYGGGGGAGARCAVRVLSCIKQVGAGGGGAGSSFVTSSASGVRRTGGGSTASVTISYAVPAPVAIVDAPVSTSEFDFGEAVPTTFRCTSGPGGPAIDCTDSLGAPAPSGLLDTATAGAHQYTVTATNSFGISAATTVDYVVRKGIPDLEWEAAEDVVYGTPLSDVELNATASVSGTFVYSPPSETVLDAGDHELTAAFTPDDTDNWEVVDATVGLTVTPAPLVVTASDASRPSGAQPPTIEPLFDGLVNGDTAADLDVAPACIAHTTSESPVGTYRSTCADGSDHNYALSYVPGVVTVTVAESTLDAHDVSVVQMLALADSKVIVDVRPVSPPAAPTIDQPTFTG